MVGERIHNAKSLHIFDSNAFRFGSYAFRFVSSPVLAAKTPARTIFMFAPSSPLFPPQLRVAEIPTEIGR